MNKLCNALAILPLITSVHFTPLPVEKKMVLTPAYVKEYVTEQAIKVGVDPLRVQWIVSHESQYCQRMSGDDGQSIGCWMISLKWHPEVDLACSKDLACSTAWSLKHIKDGYINEWSTWRLRFKLYPNEKPPK